MDANMQEQAEALRSMSSKGAADWLLHHYPLGSAQWGNVILLMEHLSLQRADWTRLARHYLAAAPFAQDRPYKLFARQLGVSRFLTILAHVLPANADRRDLLRYQLEPLLRDAKDEDRATFASLTG